MRTIRVDQEEQEEKDTDFQVLYKDLEGAPEGFGYSDGVLYIIYGGDQKHILYVSDLKKFKDALNKTIDLLKEQGEL